MKISVVSGGFDPIKFSNTYKLYQKNWSGLIIEPNKDKAKNWKKIRPRDHIVNSAIVEKNYEKKILRIFFDKKNSAMATAYPVSNVEKLNYYDLIILCTKHDEYKKISLKSVSKKTIFIDLNNSISTKTRKLFEKNNIQLFILGKN